ncbi:MAG: response regulator transcription factor [Clostridiales Family XIII bacterium]|jgi:two-component system alkaline phosphatase synthesis response regulator PhoP|nr:response regulator transcription factor [Clostridiales Family XIII bacterium]
MKTIYILEDDTNIRELVIYALKSSDYEAVGFAEPSSFYDELERTIPDLVLLDIMLPEEDGITILKKLRQADRTSSLPIIMLTSKGNEIDRVQGLDQGADDYVTKPFSVVELISRVGTVLRRANGTKTNLPVITEGPITLNMEKRKVTVDGKEIVLTFKEFELVHLFLRNIGIVLSRDKLVEEVWGYDYAGETRTVDVHIKTLRQKFGRAGYCIKTVRGVGYKLEIGDAKASI